MKTKLCAALRDGLAWIAALHLMVSAPAFAQTRLAAAVLAFAASSAAPQLPSGTKLVARVPLGGRPVTHMYTMSEYGRTFLYIGHGPYSFTTEAAGGAVAGDAVVDHYGETSDLPGVHRKNLRAVS